MRVKIFTVHHFMPEEWVANDLYVPFVNGLAIGSHPTVMCDEKGDNIAHIPSHGDMRTPYYVWKNLLGNYDYVGFQHYRRYFFFDRIESIARHPLCRVLRQHILKNAPQHFIGINHDLFRAYRQSLQQYNETEIEAIKEFISRYDILTINPFVTPLAMQYCASHYQADWDVFVRIVSKHPRFVDPANLALDANLLNSCNMFIMRVSEFDEYMIFWQEVMTEVAKEVKPHEDLYQMRVYVYLAERLFTLYLYQHRLKRPSLRITEIPALVCEEKRDTTT